jgi:hypothetical protein
MTNLPQHIQDTLAAERKVIEAGELVRATGGSEAACIAYDAAQKHENAMYEIMNSKGATKDQWKAYDRIRADMYRNANI